MQIKGFVEQVSNLQVRGWAYYPDDPAGHVAIEVSLGTEIIARATANLYRQDLERAKVGNGDHAFVVNFPVALEPESIVSVNVAAFSNELEKVPLSFVGSAPAAIPTSAFSIPADDESIDPEERPLFILGAARSGTSAMAQSLLKSGAYEGFEEGHFLELAGRLMVSLQAYYDDNGGELSRPTLAARVPRRFVAEGIKDIFRATTRYAFPTGRWLDKTPKISMVTFAPLFREIWPNARFIFMKRRAIENILSRLKKFPEIPFEIHCEDWTNTMKEWREIRVRLAGSAIEVEQMQMASQPIEVARSVTEFLSLGKPASRRFTEILTHEHPERTAIRFGTGSNIENVDWPPHKKAKFLEICGGELKLFNYSLDEEYYHNGDKNPITAPS